MSTITLTTPLIIDGEAVTSVTITEAKFTFDVIVAMEKPVMERDPNDTKNIFWRPKSEAEQSRFLLAHVLGTTEREIGKLSMTDVAAIMGAVSPFLETSPAPAIATPTTQV